MSLSMSVNKHIAFNSELINFYFSCLNFIDFPFYYSFLNEMEGNLRNHLCIDPPRSHSKRLSSFHALSNFHHAITRSSFRMPEGKHRGVKTLWLFVYMCARVRWADDDNDEMRRVGWLAGCFQWLNIIIVVCIFNSFHDGKKTHIFRMPISSYMSAFVSDITWVNITQ